MNVLNDSKFVSISPSAMSLLETRFFTSIPFVKESFKLITKTNSDKSKEEKKFPQAVILRIMHFESRYLSIDQGIKELGCNKILEFSSGFSFRGLDFCKDPIIQYIDTDLSTIIETKKNIISELIKDFCDYQPNNLLLQSMNALNEKEFLATVSKFGSGPITIVNEGLLMYLDVEQKEALCKIIHKILSQYGGYWITADIYRKGEIEGRNIENFYKQKGKEFLEKHNVEKNKFDSFEDAKEIFSRCGLEIYKKIEINPKILSSSKLFHKNYPSEKPEYHGKAKTRETWILKPV